MTEAEAGVMCLKMAEGTTGRGVQVDSSSWKSKEIDSPLEPPEGMQPRQPILDVCPPEL